MKTVLTPRELANQLRVSASQVCRLAASGKIPGAKDLGTGGANHKWRFTEEIIDKWLMEETQATRHRVPPRRRQRKATPVQRSIKSRKQVKYKKKMKMRVGLNILRANEFLLLLLASLIFTRSKSRFTRKGNGGSNPSLSTTPVPAAT